MAALTATTPVVTGTVATPPGVSSSDTIDASILGQRGAYLVIVNGNASSDTVTIKDFGATPAGNSLTTNQFAKSVTNGTSQVFHIKPSQVDPSTGLVTVTHSVTPTVSYYLFPVL